MNIKIIQELNKKEQELETNTIKTNNLKFQKKMMN